MSFRESLPCGESHRKSSIPPALSYDHMRKILSPRRLIRDSVPTAFIRGWSCRYPLPGTCQQSRLPQGKQVFSGLSTVRGNQ